MGKNIKIKEQRTYIEDDYQLAYSKARRELGPNLVILEKKDVKVGGFLGLFTKKKIRVTYGVEEVVEKKKEFLDSENKDILDLLKKMGFEDNGKKNNNIIQNEELDIKQHEPKENIGTYTPYKLNNFKNNKKEEDIESIKNKIKEEIQAEIKLELQKELLQNKPKEVCDSSKLILQNTSCEDNDIFKKLKYNDVSNEIVCDIEKYIKNKDYVTDTEIYRGIREYFVENIEIKEKILESKIIMLVGPTGVGKTTSCAKIVAKKWQLEKSVAFITADTYRLEAVSQLKAYANIMQAPIEVVREAEELVDAIKKFKDKDFIIMDTAGRSPKNKEQMDELKVYVEKLEKEIDVCLVLSATSKLSVLYETIEKFKYIGFTSIIFTKLDETTGIGALLSIYKKYKIPISFITTGQRVPDDIELPTKERLSEIFVEGLKNGSS